MLDGGHFVEALDRLGYPGVASLKPSEFDWLFDCAPENLHFLRFVCRTLNRSNVLTPEEVQAFQELQKSGKPILDEAALGEVLKSVRAPDGGGANILGFSSNSSSLLESEEDFTSEELEAELQALQREKYLKQRRHDKLQVVATTRADVDLRLAAELEAVTSKLKEANACIGAENADTNAALQSLTDEVGRLASYLPVGLKDESQAKAEPVVNLSEKHTCLLSNQPLDPYLRQEEVNTKTLALFMQKQFFQGISDIIETSSSDRLQIVDLSYCDAGEEDGNEGMGLEERQVEHRRTEMARLQWAHIVAQHQLMQAMAEEKSVRAGLALLSEKSSHTKSISSSSFLHVREASARKELQAVTADLEALMNGPVPAALRESARLLNVPVVRGDLALQLIRQDYYTSSQDQVRDYLLRQKASFDLILLAQEMELRRWRSCQNYLREINDKLVTEGEAASLRIKSLAHPDLAINLRPNPIISCNDSAFCRLLHILDQGLDSNRSEPYRTYKALDRAASELASNLRTTQEALAGVRRQQLYTAACLNGDCEALQQTTYSEIQQLVLGPQVRPMATTAQDLLCPNAQELTVKLQEAESQLQSLQRVMQEILGEVKSKRPQLERSSLLRRERELYVYFHLDPRLLQKVVEDLEGKTADRFSTGFPQLCWVREEMEPPDSRLHTGDLSQAALRILAVLRSQSVGARRYQAHCSYNRQVESIDDSRRRTWSEEYTDRSLVSIFHQNPSETLKSQNPCSYQFTQTSLSSRRSSGLSSCEGSFFQRQTSQVEDHNRHAQDYSHRKSSERSAQCCQSFYHGEVYRAESSSHREDRAALCIQIPPNPSLRQASPQANSSAQVEPSFILTDSPDEDQPDESHFPVAGQYNCELQELPANSHRVSSCRPLPEKTEDEIYEYKMKTGGRIHCERTDESDVVLGTLTFEHLCPPTEEATAISKAGTHEVRHLHPGQADTQTVASSQVTANADARQASRSELYLQNAALPLVKESTSGKRHTYVSESSNALASEWASHLPDSNVTDDELQPSIDIKAFERHSRSPEKAGRLKISVCGSHVGRTGTESEESHTQDPPVLSSSAALVLENDSVSNWESVALLERWRKTGHDERAEHKLQARGLRVWSGQKKRCETNDGTAAGGSCRGNVHPGMTDAVKGAPAVLRLKDRKSAEDSERERLPASARPSECVIRKSGFRPPLNRGNQKNHENSQITSGSSRSCSTALMQTTADVDSLGQKSTPVYESNSSLAAVRSDSTIPSFSAKRKHERLQDQNDTPNSKICLTWQPPKWKPPCSMQKKRGEEKAKRSISASVPGSQTVTVPSRSSDTELRGRGEAQRTLTHQDVEKRNKQDSKTVTSSESGDHVEEVEHVQGELTASEQHIGSKANCLAAALTSDSRVRCAEKMNPDEKIQMLEKAREAKVLLLTMVHRDGSTQLDPEQKGSTQTVCGLLVLMKSDTSCSPAGDSLGPGDSLVYLKLEHTPAWAQQHVAHLRSHHSQQTFTRDLLHLVLSSSELVVCYKAKDLLRAALQIYREDLSCKQVAGCHIHDPQVSGWLLDPADPSSCFQSLLHKHFRRPFNTPALGSHKVSKVLSAFGWLLRLDLKLCSDLKKQSLWCLYTNMELRMIPVLASMESHRIHVDKETLKETSDLLGTKLKHLEQEAHQAAGQKFLLTSNTQLRTVLFEKLRLHTRCVNKRLPKTINKQQQSTSEAALLQLQDLHPLPKIILEYRQVHKIKSTFVDGILSCMMSKSYISSTWHQTSVVTGRISAKHPNFQALPRQPLQITRKQYVTGKEEEMVTVHPRAMFVPREGWTFLAADFCQVELRLLAHLSSDPELLRIFTTPQADVFTMLASQWKGVAEGEVTSEDREQAKRVVYSVVYGAGRERLSGILGVSTEQARRFQDSFLQTYRDVQEFIQRTIQQSREQRFVLSIMGRRRTLPHISSPDWAVRMQAERQAVNFVVQGSAADLCKMAMIRIYDLISSSSSPSPRLLAQLHDELLYEVPDPQVHEFAELVRGTMESLQHTPQLGVHLKVPLKVAMSCGKSWGSMCDLPLPPTSRPPH